MSDSVGIEPRLPAMARSPTKGIETTTGRGTEGASIDWAAGRSGTNPPLRLGAGREGARCHQPYTRLEVSGGWPSRELDPKLTVARCLP